MGLHSDSIVINIMQKIKINPTEIYIKSHKFSALVDFSGSTGKKGLRANNKAPSAPVRLYKNPKNSYNYENR